MKRAARLAAAAAAVFAVAFAAGYGWAVWREHEETIRSALGGRL